MDIQTQDGILLRGVPDGTPDEAIKARIHQIRVGNQTAADRELYDPTKGMSGTDKFLSGAGKAFTDLGRGVRQLVTPDAPTLSGLVTGDKRSGVQQEIDESRKLDAPLMNTGAGTAGNIVGNVAATLPAMFVPGVNTVVGGAALGGGLGALGPVATGESRLENAGMGALGGAGGQIAANTIGRALRPVQSQLSSVLRPLADKAESTYGIPLNAAQKTGSRPLQIIDSVLENLPLTADRQLAEKAAQRGAFNKATLSTIGEDSTLATPEVLNAARTRLGAAFNDISGRNTVQMGDPFLDALVKVDAARTPFSAPGISTAVDKGLDLASKGNISGVEYQRVRTSLGKAASDAFSSGNSETGQALKSIKGALDDAANSSVSAADKEAWGTARKQWQALKVVEKAAAPTSADAVAGNVSAAKLAQALQSVDKKGFTYGTSNPELSDLARIGQAFVKDQIPNSGTAQRQFYQRFLENPLSASWQAGVGGISLPVQALLHSAAGQRYLGQGPTSETTKRLAAALRATAGAGGTGLALTNSQQ